MLKRRGLEDCVQLFDLLQDKSVFPYARDKASCLDEYFFVVKKIIDEEQRGSTFSRTILDEMGSPIGTIGLYDIENNRGFLATWIGVSYQGKGYNGLAKQAFLEEVFLTTDIEEVIVKIRVTNEKSLRAFQKVEGQSELSCFDPLYQVYDPTVWKLYKITPDYYVEQIETQIEA